jgi:preprotein translocase subunit YajC
MLDVGKTLVLNGGEQARVVKVTEESIDVDLSHPGGILLFAFSDFFFFVYL